MSSIRRITAVSFSAFLLVGVAGACSNTTTTTSTPAASPSAIAASPSPSGSPSASASPAETQASPTSAVTDAPMTGSPNGIESKTGDEALAESKKAAESASSFRVTTDFTDTEDNTNFDFELTDSGSQGSLTTSQGDMKLIYVDDTVYIQGDSAFYRKYAGASAGKLLEGKWLSVPADSAKAKDFKSFSNGKTFIETLLVPSQTLTMGEATEVRGTPAVAVTTSTENIYIASVGQPYPLQIASKGDSGKIDFTAWDAPVTISPPPSAEVIDISKLKD